jgi:hypothetical protein
MRRFLVAVVLLVDSPRASALVAFPACSCASCPSPLARQP